MDALVYKGEICVKVKQESSEERRQVHGRAVIKERYFGASKCVLCSARIALMHDIAIEVVSESYNYGCNDPLKGLETRPCCFSTLTSTP